ncbi:MAG: acetate--CoA ligase family protein [Candidatus Bathyarchaeia archaeon]
MAPAAVDRILHSVREQNRRVLLEPEAKELCRAYGMPTPAFGVAHTPSEAAELANKVQFPVVLKVVSQDILHKTEAGGVLLDLNSKEEVEDGYGQIVDKVRAYNEKARISGVLVQHMAPKGVEVIVGGLRDSQFGPTVLFGLGGIFVEVLKDASFRVAPLSDLDTRQMIREIRAYSILQGVRGQPAADEEAIMQILQATSKTMMENQPIQQMDLNPVIVYATGASVVDVRIILGE